MVALEKAIQGDRVTTQLRDYGHILEIGVFATINERKQTVCFTMYSNMLDKNHGLSWMIKMATHVIEGIKIRYDNAVDDRVVIALA
jgi:hypothetical protein